MDDKTTDEIKRLLIEAVGNLYDASRYCGDPHALSKIEGAQERAQRAYAIIKTYGMGELRGVEQSSGPGELDYTITYENGEVYCSADMVAMYLKAAKG